MSIKRQRTSLRIYIPPGTRVIDFMQDWREASDHIGHDWTVATVDTPRGGMLLFNAPEQPLPAGTLVLCGHQEGVNATIRCGKEPGHTDPHRYISLLPRR